MRACVLACVLTRVLTRALICGMLNEVACTDMSVGGMVPAVMMAVPHMTTTAAAAAAAAVAAAAVAAAAMRVVGSCRP